MKSPELLAPAGDLVSLRAAIDNGADAVYFGVKAFNMRASAKNFEVEQMKKVVSICHENNVKAYLTLNVIIYDDELDQLKKVVNGAKDAGVDAVICWDNSVINACKKIGLEFHISTQASISNFESVKFYSNIGATRLVLARECTLSQIKEIKKKIKKDKLSVEIETFIHGAMCVSVSGRCFISQFLHCKSANRGECLQPCRRSYKIIDKETDEELEVANDFVLSPKDMCTIQIIDELIESGIDCFKIEGRMRSPEYVAKTVKVYRDAIDTYSKEGVLTHKTKEMFENELKTVYNRDFSTGFFMGKPINGWTDEYGSKATKKKVYLGKVKNYYPKIGVFEFKLETRGIKVGDTLMVQGPTTGVVEQVIESMHSNKPVDEANQKEMIGIKFDKQVRKNDKVFLIE